MKKYLLKTVLIILMFMLIYSNIVSANYMIFEATKMNIEVQNINEEIKSIWLVIYDENVNVVDVYKNSGMDFSKAHFLGAYPNKQYKYCAVFNDTVEPFTDEDYVFNDNYDKKNYVVDQDISYTYTYGKKSYGDSSKGKYKDPEELINDGFYKKDKDKIRKENIICERSIFYSAKRLVEIKEISVTEIKDNILYYSILDFSELKKYREIDVNAGFALRFENEKGEFKTLKIGTNDIFQDAYKKNEPDEANLEKEIKLDYTTTKVINDNTEINYSTGFSAKGVIFAILVTLLAKLLVAKIMKIDAIKIIIVVSIITQLLLYGFIYIIIPKIHDNIVFDNFPIIIVLGILIVLFEFVIYKKKIENQSTKKLFQYSFIANFTSFGILVFGILVLMMLAAN